MAHILVVDDEPKMTSLICGTLEDEGHTVETTVNPAEALKLIDSKSYDIVITDLSMPEISGMKVLDTALEKGGMEVILMTAYGTVETAVEAMKKGAADYLLKPFSLEELAMIVKKLGETARVSSLKNHYETVLRDRRDNEFIGKSPSAERVKKLIRQVAPSEATVLLTGNTGTGKELAAWMLHSLSPRKDAPFIAINCASLTETLLESELFGHEKGAFTGAVSRKRGRYELADGGTIFLDEIGEMSPGLQSKLLRVLEEQKLVRVGGLESIDLDVRVIAATNRNLKDRIESGAFREDLYFRLNVFPIALPSLKERSEDVILLSSYFLEQQRFQHSQLSPEVEQLLLDYDWPGNIRELKNVLERAVILSGGEPLTADDFSIEPEDRPIGKPLSEGQSSGAGLESAEKEMIIHALKQTGGNKTEAAKLLKITRRRLYSRMKAHDIEV
jgi:DNA-binding NtrC family response regulator